MPRLDDAAAVLHALHAALADHQHWIFLSDTPTGHELLGSLVVSVILLEGADPTYGRLCLAHPQEDWQLALSIVIICKKFLSKAQVNRLLKFVRKDAVATDGFQDVFPMVSAATPPERIRAIFADAALFVQAANN
jgi:hypothetical protein